MDIVTVQDTVTYLRSFGLLAPLVAFGLFFIQAVFPVFPYFIMAGAAGIIFGFWNGFLLAWVGALAGACFAFGVVRLTNWEWLHKWLQNVMKRDSIAVNPLLGFWGIVMARIFPVVPTPLINVVAGISGISFLVFFSASAIGKIPVAIIYTGLGNHLITSGDIKSTAAVLILVMAATLLGVWFLKKRGIYLTKSDE